MFGGALEVPLYRFFTDKVAIKAPKLPKSETDSSLWGARRKERGAFRVLVKALSRMDEPDRMLLLSMAQGMARRGQSRDPLRAMRLGVYWRRAAKSEFQTARIQGGQDE